MYCLFFSSSRRHTRCGRDWSSDVCSSDLVADGAARTGISRWAAGTGSFRVKGRNIFLDGLKLDGGDELKLVNGTLSFGGAAERRVGKERSSRMSTYHIKKRNERLVWIGST